MDIEKLKINGKFYSVDNISKIVREYEDIKNKLAVSEKARLDTIEKINYFEQHCGFDGSCQIGKRQLNELISILGNI